MEDTQRMTSDRNSNTSLADTTRLLEFLIAESPQRVLFIVSLSVIAGISGGVFILLVLNVAKGSPSGAYRPGVFVGLPALVLLL